MPTINTHGIGWANRAVFERLIAAVEADRYIVDGNLKLDLSREKRAVVRSLVRADQSEQAVSAASIVAKVSRDRLMSELHQKHPIYGWDHNAGYCTREHLRALVQHGLTAHHRRQFVETALGNFSQRTLEFEAIQTPHSQPDISPPTPLR